MRGLARGGLCQESVRSVLAGLLAMLWFVPSLGASHATVQVGQPAPPFVLPSIRSDASPIALADYRGKLVYVDFWSSWCAPCRRTMPQLSRLRDELPRERFEVIAVNVDLLPSDARRFLDDVAVSFPVAVDPLAETADAYGVGVLPWAVLVGPDGIVREVYSGEGVGRLESLRRAMQSSGSAVGE